MSNNIRVRLYWMIFMPIWVLITSTLIIPMIWYVVTGRNWIDPETIYNRIKQNNNE
jgi:hypothetical protein